MSHIDIFLFIKAQTNSFGPKFDCTFTAPGNLVALHPAALRPAWEAAVGHDAAALWVLFLFS